MKTLFLIAFRNLFRQKRRNVLLGAAIAIGTLVLVLANSFSHGISRTLINDVVSYVAGHTSVGYAHRGQLMSQVMRGGAGWREKIEQIPGVKKVTPTMGTMGRGIGNGKSDNVFVVAIDMHAKFTAEDSIKTTTNFPMVEGEWKKLTDSTIENPLIISTEKAKFLNVKKGDILRVRLQDFDGHFQAVRLTVVGIFRPSNIFMESAIFIELRDMSRIMGLRAEDSPYLQVTLYNPEKDAVNVADSIWRMMAPPLAYMQGTASLNGKSVSTLVSGFHADSTSLLFLKPQLTNFVGDSSTAYSRKTILLPSAIADSLHAKLGDTVHFRYALRFPHGDSIHEFKRVVGGIFATPATLPQSLALMHEHSFYDEFYDELPLQPKAPALVLDSGSAWFKELTTEWSRLDRPHSTDDFTKQRREISQGKYKGTAVTISTMYESASAVLKLESALQVITLSAVLVIFFITLIGVINTLRMTVRERTREIGTMRAIGMQQSDIRQVFLMETGLLAFFSAIAGTLLAFASMFGLSRLTIPTASNPLGIILSNGHLVFAPTVFSVISFIVLIVLIAIATAWFPASRAAKLPAATAMRHYE